MYLVHITNHCLSWISEMARNSRTTSVSNANARNMARDQDAPVTQNAGVGQVDSNTIIQNFVQAITNAMEQRPQTSNGSASSNTMRVVEQFRKLQPPFFEGSINPLVAEEWVRELEKIFRLIDCTDQQKVTCATYMLKGSASHWWEMTSRAQDMEGYNVTWDRFKELFDEKYFPQSLRDDKEAEFIQLTQGSKSLIEYERKFEELSRFAPHLLDTEARKARRFERGLKPELRKLISVLELKTYSAVLQKAQILAKDEVEATASEPKDVGQNSQNKKTWIKPHIKRSDKWKGKKRQRDDKTEKRDLPLCETCGRYHGGTCYRKTGACFKCGKPGHFIQNCPEMKNVQGGPRKDQRVQARVYALTRQEAEDSPSVVTDK
ncbi:Cellular nucleic acid-binding protein [Melia azedarach]|uniref:Cellular nucleic acid-binding protein n=1 Tax=Melia azedarach TaxID=155640 RepID=A0ACC1WV94_MELAZ|nr:Cellular nucleic acid-binding protein [Melia azedarach]